MRRIRIGDRVQSFLDSRVKGFVVESNESKNVPWMVGGTASTEFICVVELQGGQRINYKMSELHHSDE